MSTETKERGRRRYSEIARDRKIIAYYYLRGKTQAEIAEFVDLSQSTISRDLSSLQNEWKESALIDFDAAKARELARIDLLEEEYWDAWDRSKRPKTETEKQASNRGDNTSMMSREKSVERDGNPAFLMGVERCIAERCKILGVYAAVKHEHSGGDKAIDHNLHFDEEQIDKYLPDLEVWSEALNLEALNAWPPDDRDIDGTVAAS